MHTVIKDFWVFGDPRRRLRLATLTVIVMAAYGLVFNTLGGHPRTETAHQALVIGALLMLAGPFIAKREAFQRQVPRPRKDALVLGASIVGFLMMGLAAYTSQKWIAAKSLNSIPAGNLSESELDKATRLLRLAGNSGIPLPHPLLQTVFERLIAQDSSASPTFWKVATSIVSYSSSQNTVPGWVGPVRLERFPSGFPGLYGFVELKNVELYGSVKRVPLDQASVLTTLKMEDSIREFLRSRNYATWPEFEMVAGEEGSNIVLDGLHVRNVILKNMHVVYGGGQTNLENVSFVSCTFEFIRTDATIRLSDLILRGQVVRLRV